MRIRHPLGNFPFAVPRVTSAEVGPGTQYPVGMSLTEAMHLYWVANKYSILSHCVADFSAYGTFGFVDVVDGTMLIQSLAEPRSDEVIIAPNEASLCAPYRGNWRKNQYVPPLHGSYSTLDASIFYRPFGLEGSGDLRPGVRLVYCADDQLYYPSMGISISYSSNGDETTGQLSFSSFPSTLPPDTNFHLFDSPETKFTFFGRTIDGYAYRTGFARGSGTATLTVDDWWEYRGRWPMDNDPQSTGPFYEDVPLYADGVPAINPATGVPFTLQEINDAPWP